MLNRLRKILFSLPVLTVAGLFVFYLLAGYLALPAALKWQAEKQVREKLGHELSVGEVRFDPLAFEFELHELTLADAQGRPMLGLRRLFVEFEAWRSIVDGVWTFAAVTLDAPTLRFELDKESRHNFSALMERLGESGPEQEPAAASPPPVAVRRIALTAGRIEVLDQRLGEPTLTHIEPLSLSVEALSTLAGSPGQFRLKVPTATGEVLDTRGELALSPLAVNGQLAISGLQVATLVRALSHFVAIDSPAGQIDISARFDIGLDGSGQLSGSAQEIEIDGAGLSVSAVGAKLPLLALQQLALSEGSIDLGQREVAFAELKLSGGRVAGSVDAQSRIDWATLLRTRAQPEAADETPAAAPLPLETSARWRISIANVDVSAIAVDIADAQLGRSARIDALALKGSPSAEVSQDAFRLHIEKPLLTLAGVRFQQPELVLIAPALSFDSGQLSLAAAGSGFDGVLGASRLTATQGLSLDQGRDSFVTTGGSLKIASVALKQSQAKLSGTIGATQLALSGMSMKQAGLSATLDTLAIESEASTLQSAPARFDLSLKKLRSTLAAVQATRGLDGLEMREGALDAQSLGLTLAGGQLQLNGGSITASLSGLTAQQGEHRPIQPDGALALAADRRDAGLDVQGPSLDRRRDSLVAAVASLQMASVALKQNQAETSGTIGATRLALSGVTMKQAELRATLDALAIESESSTLLFAPERFELGLNQLRGTLGAMQAARGPDGLQMRKADLGTQSLSLALADGQLQLIGGSATASLSGLSAQRGEQRLALDDGKFEARTLMASGSGAPSGAANSLQAGIDDAALRLDGMKLMALGAVPELAQLTGATLTAKSLRLAQPDGVFDVIGDGLGAELSNALLRSPQEASEVLRLDLAAMAGGTLGLRERRFGADTLSFGQGELRTWLDDTGQLNLLSLFGAPAVPDTTEPAVPGTAAPWQIAVKQIQVDEFAVGFEDRRESPVLALRLEPIRARVLALDTASTTPMQVEAQATLASGGDIRVAGSVQPDSGFADLELALDGIALAPVQQALTRFADLRLESGTASGKGRLRFGDAASAPRLSYQGSVAVDRLQLEEVKPKRPFLSWDSVATDDMLLTLQPDRVDIGELRIRQPIGRLIIAADQSVNIGDVLKKSDGGATATAPTGDAAEGDPFPVSIARLRVTGGVLDFADLSLRPQFAARMQDLKGVIIGLGTDPDKSAKLQLDAKVDRYGSAKISGQISVRKPERLTEIDMSFRNLDMSSLSPYVAKFAGYKVTGGRLALDLQYRVKDSKLLGKNKFVISRVALGEKVESPDALDLPLELAIAILTDSKGVIDIGLPVSGDLDDPQFDYGSVIGKAIGDLFGGIVSAPFKALGAMFGSGDDKTLGAIAFEPGEGVLAPAEQQKLANLSLALNARPALTLVVPPTFSTALDTPVLKSLTVRSDIVERMGVKLAAGEDPGPIDVANARTQSAIEGAFSTRYAPAVLTALKRRAVEPPAAVDAETAAPPAAPAASAPPPPAVQPPPAFYQGLVDRMLSEQVVSDDQLVQLAVQRAQAVVHELTVEGGVDDTRIVLGKPLQDASADDKAVTLKLELTIKP